MQDAEKVHQQCSRIAQRLTVRPGQTPVHTGDGWAGENRVRFASSLVAALLDSLFAHPAWRFNVVSTLDIRDGLQRSSPNHPTECRYSIQGRRLVQLDKNKVGLLFDENLSEVWFQNYQAIDYARLWNRFTAL